MTDEIRKAVLLRLAELGMNPTDAARSAGLDPNYVHRMLRGEAAKASHAFVQLLHHIDLELTVTPRDKKK